MSDPFLSMLDDKTATRQRNTADAYAHKPVVRDIVSRVPVSSDLLSDVANGAPGEVLSPYVTDGQLIMLCFAGRWYARFFGCEVSDNRIALPDTLATMPVANIMKHLAGRFPRAWFLVAPGH